MTRAAARAPRNAPVRLTSSTRRQVPTSVSRGPATTGEMPALQIQTSTPPHSATVASATASLKSSSVTSPQSTSVGPGRSWATALRSRSVRATRATDAPARENACASSVPRPRPAPVTTTRFPATSPGVGNESGISIWSDIGLPLVPVSTVHEREATSTLGAPRRPGRDAAPDAADPRVRGARGRPLPRRADSRVRASLHRPGGVSRRGVLAPPARRRDHLDAPRPRPLPGQGPRSARACSPS